MTKKLIQTLQDLDLSLRDRFDLLGYVDGDAGSYKTGYVPHVAPFAYLCRRFAGLDMSGIKAAEEECGHHIPESYRAFLSHMNGAEILGVSLSGTTGKLVDRSNQGIGQPISIHYQNAIERPEYVPKGHLGIGIINGEWYSQGHLYLSSSGEVELYNSRSNLVGAKWDSLGEFIVDEIPRRYSGYDESGIEIKGFKLLPGDTDDWENIARIEDNKMRKEGGFLDRVLKTIRQR